MCLPKDSKGSATSEEECRETFTRLGRKWELSLEFMKGLKALTRYFGALKMICSIGVRLAKGMRCTEMSRLPNCENQPINVKDEVDSLAEAIGVVG